MKGWIAIGGLTALLLVPTAYAGDQAPATIKSLQNRDVTITPSQAQTASPEAQRDNYRQLLHLTRDPTKRNRILRRLADVELKIAGNASDPKPAARRALNIYQRLAANKSYREREADLLYNAAHAADLAGDVAAQITALSRLIDNYPDFNLLPEARFRRAETRFVNTNYRLAEQDYTWLISRGTDTPFLLQAYYKRGWTRYKLDNYRAALRDELTVLRRLAGPDKVNTDGSLDTARLSQAQQEVVDDALRNMTLDFVELGDNLTPSKFAQVPDAKPYSYVLTKHLIDYYLQKQRYTDASNTALTFAKKFPDHPQAKALEVQSIGALEKGGFTVPARKAKEAFVIRYGIDKESWYGKDPLTLPKVRQRLQDYLDEITRSLHAGAQKTDLPADYLEVADWYAKYLQIFPHSKRAPELAFFQAETLEQAKHYAQAAKAYEQVAYAMAPNDHAADAGYAAVLDWRKAAGDNVATDKNVETATLRFAKAYPNQKQATAVLARLAEDRYEAHDLAAADHIAGAIINHRPPAAPEDLTNAWRIRAAAANQAKDYAKAEKAHQWLAGHTSGKERSKSEHDLAADIYQQGEALADAGNDSAAIAEFLRLRKTVPAGSAQDVRSTALYDASAASIRSGDKQQAVTLLQRFRSEYPNNKLAPKTTRKLAELQLELGNKQAAADEFARVRKQTDIDASARRDAALETAQLNAETGNTSAAIAAYEEYLNVYNPAFSDRIEAEHQLVVLNQKAGRSAGADRWRKRLIAADAGAGAQRSDRSKTLAAQATLAMAGRARASYEAAHLTLPLKRSLRVKKARLEKALDAYGDVAQYGIAETTTAATYRTAALYHDFSQALSNAPHPRNLSADQLSQYKVLLKQQALPFETKAIHLHEANIKRMSGGVNNQWTKKSLAQLTKLASVHYTKTERVSNAIVTLQ